MTPSAESLTKFSSAEVSLTNTPTGKACTTEAPLHNAPSMQDLLDLKRQRRSFDDDAREMQHSGHMPSNVQQQPSDNPNISANVNKTNLVHPLETSKDEEFLSSPSFVLPVLPAVIGEPMSKYMQRLRQFLGALPEGIRAMSSQGPDGIYVHKRPVRGPDGKSPLAVCGSVLHHVIVQVKQGPCLHSLDFGPANGADVTANILEAAPSKKVWVTEPVVVDAERADAADEPGAAGALASSTGPQEVLPYLYLGHAHCDLEHPLVHKVVAFAESQLYHALSNNCIHFADVLVRVLTAGAIRGAPLLYDLVCGCVPLEDNPMLFMLQLMLGVSWFTVVDSSRLAASFVEHWRISQLPADPHITVMESEDRDNNVHVVSEERAVSTERAQFEERAQPNTATTADATATLVKRACSPVEVVSPVGPSRLPNAAGGSHTAGSAIPDLVRGTSEEFSASESASCEGEQLQQPLQPPQPHPGSVHGNEEEEEAALKRVKERLQERENDLAVGEV